MEPMIAYCGLVCTDCPAYVATQANDRVALEQVAERWRVEFNTPSITVESILCDGCLGTQGRKMSHCFECEIRACAMERGLPNCAHCSQYACKTLEAFLTYVPDAHARLDGLRAGLAG